jgi:hypothetical protein
MLYFDMFLQGHEQNQLYGELDRIVDSKCVKLDGAFSCSDCNFQTKYGTNMKNHVESKHLTFEVRIPCLYCETYCPTRGAMRAHVKRLHSFKMFQ